MTKYIVSRLNWYFNITESLFLTFLTSQYSIVGNMANMSKQEQVLVSNNINDDVFSIVFTLSLSLLPVTIEYSAAFGSTSIQMPKVFLYNLFNVHVMPCITANNKFQSNVDDKMTTATLLIRTFGYTQRTLNMKLPHAGQTNECHDWLLRQLPCSPRVHKSYVEQKTKCV